jgi:pimeloyl-ACP methyl ester carboxylesterase
MTTFVLVHGSFSGGYMWRQVADGLRRQDHDVFTPTLSGLADRAHLARNPIGLSTHIDDVANLLHWEDLKQVVLVGHSYGGVVVTGVAARQPERLARLIYLDAYIPRGGQSWFDVQTPEDAATARAEMADGWRQPIPAAALGIADPELAAWVDERMSPQPRATYEEACPMGGPEFDRIPRAFIRCTQGPLAPRFAPALAYAEKSGWQTRELACGHNAMLIVPDQVVRVLLELSLSIQPAR